MNETKWLTGSDGLDMLAHVADGLRPRQWAFAAAAYVRRLWDFLPDGPLRQAVDAVERAAEPMPAAERADWLRRVDATVPEAVGAAELAQHDIVRLCDPDAADQDTPVLSRPNQIAPAFPLFSAASRHARNAIEFNGEAVSRAANAVRGLLGEPNELMLDRLRERVEEAIETRTRANQAAANALRFKQEGDEHADRAAGVKNKRLEESKAVEFVRRVEEGRNREGADVDAELKRERAANRQLARVLREVVGNPFTPPRFDPAWRTATVVALARGIFEERAWDRLPILADALLDADCDEEPVLRHLRGTEVGSKEPPVHVRGCWVIELILGRWEPLPPPAPGSKPRRKRDPWDDLDLLEDLDGDRFA